MATKFKTHWHRESAFIKNAFLYNCRDNDLQRNRKGWIKEGQIVRGAVGYVIAEHNVPGFNGKIVSFKQNRECRWPLLDCRWPDLKLRCMTHKDIPRGSHPRPALRRYNYIIALLPDDEEAVKIAVEKDVPVIITMGGKFYVNLEISTIPQIQDKNRKAELI